MPLQTFGSKEYSQDDMYRIALRFRSLRDKAMFSLAYLTACRVGEMTKTLRKKHVSFTIESNRQVCVFKLPNQKNRRMKIKKLPIPMDMPNEARFVNIVKEYIGLLQDEDLLFDITRQRAWKIIREHFPTPEGNKNWIRHWRLTHLVTMYDYNGAQLTRFAGWTNMSPAKYYLELRLKDLVFTKK